MTFKTALVAAVIIGIGAAYADPIKRDDLVGAWEYIESYSQFADGRKENQFSDKPRGIFVILPNGLYSHIIMADDLPRVGSGQFKNTTLFEAEKIAEGVLAHFGTWVADEKNGTFTVKIKKSSFSNFDDVSQIRTVTKLDKDNLSYVNDRSVAAEKAIVVAKLRRVW